MLYLFAAFFISWVILGVYILALHRQIQALRAELEALREQRRHGSEVPADLTKQLSQLP